MNLSGVFAAWREVPAIVLGLIFAIPLAFLTRWRWLALIPVLLLGWVFYFFRDPERVPASHSSEFIIAPADGKVTDIELVDESLYIQGQARRTGGRYTFEYIKPLISYRRWDAANREDE
jgi:hypothetical protein